MKEEQHASDIESDQEFMSTKGSYLQAGKMKISLTHLRTILVSMSLVILGIGIGYQYRDFSLRQGLVRGFENGNLMGLDRENLDFTLFWEVWDTLQRSYLEPDDLIAQQMVFGAIEGMTASLGDPYTVFLPPADNQQAKEDLNGEFDGIGIQLGYKRDTIAVMAPLDEHPAIKQGVKAGDLILHIKDDDKGVDTDTSGMTLPEAVKIIRGRKGMPVTLTLYRDDKGTFEVSIVRDTIVIPSVELELGSWNDGAFEEKENGPVAWLKLRRFGENTQAQWDTAVQMILNNRNGLTGIVLDVRNNPGGFLQGAINLASDFIPEGTVVEQQGRYDTETYTVSRRGRLLGVPVVVLINGGSASASEILAGAMRDRIEAQLVGERSFGKGTVQEAIDLQGNAGLHVTSARWLLPSGDWIHDDGLQPDIEIALAESDPASDSAELVDVQLKRAIEVLESQ
jgi:carboxyl-terminal processing protease